MGINSFNAAEEEVPEDITIKLCKLKHIENKKTQKENKKASVTYS